MDNRIKAIKDFQKSMNKANRFRDQLLSNPALVDVIKRQNGIRHNSTLVKALELKNLYNWSSYFPNASFNQYMKQIDAITTIKKYPNLLSQSLTYSSVINKILQNVNTDLFDDIDYDETIEDFSESVDLEFEEDIQYDIKRPAFFSLAFKINYVIYTTDSEVEKGSIKGNDKSNWEKVAKPILGALFSVFLAWSFSNTPITDSNIYKGIDSVVEYIDSIDIDEDEINNDNCNENK